MQHTNTCTYHVIERSPCGVVNTIDMGRSKWKHSTQIHTASSITCRARAFCFLPKPSLTQSYIALLFATHANTLCFCIIQCYCRNIDISFGLVGFFSSFFFSLLLGIPFLYSVPLLPKLHRCWRHFRLWEPWILTDCGLFSSSSSSSLLLLLLLLGWWAWASVLFW